MPDALRCFAVCPRGVEPALAGELTALGFALVEARSGGAAFETDLAGLYRANLALRTANRVLLALSAFPCRGADDLYAAARAVEWERWASPRQTIAVRTAGDHPAVRDGRFAALKVKDAVCDRFRDRAGERPAVDADRPDLSIHLYLSADGCVLSLDASGRPLHERGYRRETGEAPLRETLAAALLLLAEWKGDATLVDPMCGSGTIAIEAALLAGNVAPGLLNPSFGFQRWGGFEPRRWKGELERAEAARRAQAAPIFASDRDRKTADLAHANAARAGVSGAIRFSVSDALALEPPPGPKGILLSNPPYGERIGEAAILGDLYKRWGDALQERWKGWTAYLFTGNAELAKRMFLKTSRRWVLWNGPIECRLLKYDIYGVPESYA